MRLLVREERTCGPFLTGWIVGVHSCGTSVGGDTGATVGCFLEGVQILSFSGTCSERGQADCMAPAAPDVGLPHPMLARWRRACSVRWRLLCSSVGPSQTVAPAADRSLTQTLRVRLQIWVVHVPVYMHAIGRLEFFAALDLRPRWQPLRSLNCWSPHGLGCVAASALALKLIYVQSECVRRLFHWNLSACASDAVAAPRVRAHHLPDAVDCAVDVESEPFSSQSPHGP